MKKALKYEIYNKKGEMYEFIVELVDNAVTAYIIAPLTDNDLHPFYIERLSFIEDKWTFDNKEIPENILEIQKDLSDLLLDRNH